jgi:cytoskeletal protein RodZ
MALKAQLSRLRAASGRYRTADEVGKILRARREEKDLTVAEIAHELGVPASQLLALEAGKLEAFPSQLAVLGLLRRYAKRLRLDGDALALALLDNWAVEDSPEYLAESGRVASQGDGEATKTTTEVPQLEVATPPRARRRDLARRAVPLPFKVMFWLSAFLVLAGIVGNVLEHAHPQWFASLKRPVLNPTTVTSPTAGAPSAPPSSVQASSSTSIAGAVSSYTVHASSFSLKISASDLCWAEVTSLSNQQVLFAQELQAGQYTVLKSLRAVDVQVGSASCTLDVITGTTVAQHIVPSSAPATFTIKAS